MYGICCVPFSFGKPLVKNTFFNILSQKNAQIVNLKKSGFVFDPKNPPWVWTLWIRDPFLDLSKKTQNPLLDAEIQIWIPTPPPKKETHPISSLVKTLLIKLVINKRFKHFSYNGNDWNRSIII